MRIPTALLNKHDLETCLASSKINDNVINNFVLEDGSKDVSVISTRFFVDIKKEKTSSEIMNHFSADLHTEKRIICIPVHKNEKHWFFIAISPNSHVILSVDSLGGCNASDSNVVAGYFKEYLIYHKKEFYPKQWRIVEHTGFQGQKTAVDCGVYMLINLHCLIHDSFPDENYYDINNLRYCIAPWIVSKALVVSDDSCWYPKNRLSEEQAKVEEASEEDRVLTVSISNYLDFVKEKRDYLISGINDKSMKSGICNYRLKAIDLKISRRDLEDLGKSKQMMRHKFFGDNYEKAATQLEH